MRRRCMQFVCACALLATTAGAYGQTASESAMAQQVANTIKQSGELSNYRLGVKYQDGVAWLLGTVTSQSQMDRAVALAEQVEGVEQVICKLEIDNSSVAQPTRMVAKESQPSMLVASLEETLEQSPAPMAARPAVQQMAQPAPMPRPMPQQMGRSGAPMPMAPHQAAAIRTASHQQAMQASCYGPGQGGMMHGGMGPQPMGHVPHGSSAGVSYDNAHLPGYAWPSYAAYPNYSAVTYPKQYSPSAWPYIGPFYPYPQVPLGWRKVTMEWDDGWWHLDFSHSKLQ